MWSDVKQCFLGNTFFYFHGFPVSKYFLLLDSPPSITYKITCSTEVYGRIRLLRMMIERLAVFLILRLGPLQSKLILSTNASEIVQIQTKRSYAEILNISLASFDKFTICARYVRLSGGNRIIQQCPRFLTFNFYVSSEISRHPNQYLVSYQQNTLLGNLLLLETAVYFLEMHL